MKGGDAEGRPRLRLSGGGRAMTSSAVAGNVQPGVAPIVEQIARAQRRRRVSFRIIFFLTWAIVLVALLGPIVAGERFRWDFINEYWQYIIGGATTTVVVAVLSILLAIVLA